MDRKMYIRGKIGTYFYNATEVFANLIISEKLPDELIRIRKVFYGDEKMQYMNICFKKELMNVKKPLFIYIHGGGWISGITEMRDTWVSKWAEQGFFTSSISYTYAPDKTYPAQLHEIFKAIDYIFDKKDEYNIDTDNIVLAGESAGGYYIMYAASAACDPELLTKAGIEFRHKDEFKVKALVSNCGCFKLDDLLNREKPQSKFPDMQMMVPTFLGMERSEAIKWLKTAAGQLSIPKVTDNYPPMFLIWAERDYLRFESFDLMKILAEKGIKYKEFKGTGIIGMHGWPIATIVKDGRRCLYEAEQFVCSLLPDCFEEQRGGYRLIY